MFDAKLLCSPLIKLTFQSPPRQNCLNPLWEPALRLPGMSFAIKIDK